MAEQDHGEGQQGGFRGGDEATHFLVAERGHARVSRVDFGEETRRRTPWWRNEQEGQQGGFWGGDDTTHALVAEQGHGRVSMVDFWEETRPRTNWWQHRADQQGEFPGGD